mgnify:CR=1 FL=1
MPQAVARSRREFDPDELNYLRMLQQRQSVPNYLSVPSGNPQDAQAAVGEMRGTGPGESRDARAYAASGFGGQLEGKLAEGVFQGAMQKAPLALPFAAQIAGLPRFTPKFLRKAPKGDTPAEIQEQIAHYAKILEGLTGKPVAERPRPISGTSRKDIAAGDVAYRDRLYEQCLEVGRKKRELIAKSPKTAVPAPLSSPSLDAAFNASDMVAKSPVSLAVAGRKGFPSKAEMQMLTQMAIREALGEPRAATAGPWEMSAQAKARQIMQQSFAKDAASRAKPKTK